MRQLRRSCVSFLVPMLAAAVGAGCGGSGGNDGSGTGNDGGSTPYGGDAAGLKNLTPSNGGSGIDLSTYPTQASLTPAGGSLTVPGGPTLTVAPGVLGVPASLGVRAAASPPTVGAPGYTVLSSWYELATSSIETIAATGAIVLDLPATPPVEAASHPGLQLLAIVNGLTLPIDGTFDATTGMFHVELLGLPPSFTFALAFNPNIQKLSSDDPTILQDTFTVERDVPIVPWSTLDWWIVFDGSIVKLDGAKKVLAWAKAAATTYSNTGLKEPFLRKETVGTKARWTIHLTTDGSYFSEGVDADHGLFGRQYMSVDRIASLSTDSLGSGQASVAHEMFHAIFRSYNIPNEVFCDPAKECQRSYSGINEGMATSAGYFIDQGSPAKPRPNQTVRPLWWPFGYFATNDADTMYMNQDFFVYLLRVGTLANFRMHLEALASSVIPANADFFGVLNAYDMALDASTTGFGGNFTQTWAWYTADRAYARSPDGWLWPTEPAGGTPGATYTLDASLFSAGTNITITDKDCMPGTNSLDCEIILLSNQYPLGALVVSANVGGLALPSALATKPLTGSFDAFVSGGSAAFTVFGEKNGKGSASAAVRSPEGSTVTLANVGTDYPTVRMVVVPSGVPSPTMMVDMSFAVPAAANVWILCEGLSGSNETYGCIGWDGDTTITDASDECLFSGYMAANAQFTTRAACAAQCVTTAAGASWRVCQTPS